MFRVNNIDTRATLLTSFQCLHFQSYTVFTQFSVTVFTQSSGRQFLEEPLKIKSSLSFNCAITKICVAIRSAEDGTRMGGIQFQLSPSMSNSQLHIFFLQGPVFFLQHTLRQLTNNMRDSSFITYAKFSEKLTFLTPYTDIDSFS